jgi:uncharacterized NAD-dependent epimerase/dehydratase family protein
LLMSSTSPCLNHAPFDLEGRRTLLLADGEFSTFGAKTAVCYLRYRPDDVVAVVDAQQAGSVVQDALGFGGAIPIVASVADAAAFRPQLAVVGVAPRGGRLDARLRRHVMDCVTSGIDIVSGLHDFLDEDSAIAEAAASAGARLWDVRRVPSAQVVGSGDGCTTGARTIMVVGSDCNVGKMTATVELYNEARSRGVNAAWAATGQTGMMLRGRGIAVDRVVSDFVSGATEALVNEEGVGADIVFVEGQGSIVHPGYAAVTLGLLYGAMPDCMVMVHAATRERIGDTDFTMPPLPALVDMHEKAMSPFKISPVVAVALNTAGLADGAAHDMINETAGATGLPVSDPVRFGSSTLVDAVFRHLGAPY